MYPQSPAPQPPSSWPLPAPPPPDRRAWLGGAPLGGSDPPEYAFVEPSNPRRTIRSVAVAVLALGAAVAIAGTYLTWVTADIRGLGIRAGSGWNNVVGNVSYGPLVAFPAALAVFGCMGLLVVGWSRRWIWVIVAGLLGATAALIVQFVDISSPGRGVSAEFGVGMWVMVAGLATAWVALLVSVSVRVDDGASLRR